MRLNQQNPYGFQALRVLRHYMPDQMLFRALSPVLAVALELSLVLVFLTGLYSTVCFAQTTDDKLPASLTPPHTAKTIATTINNIDFMTEQYPPFNFMVDGTLKGISIELFDAILHELGATISSKNVRHLPWARAYKTVQYVPDSCLFVMTKTPSREPLFKWVGPIMPTTIAVLARKDRHISIHNTDDLQKYTIAALQDDIGQTLLIQNGYPANKIAINPYATGIIEMLNKKRLDAWAYEESVAKFFIQQAGYSINDFERVYVLEQSFLYFAFNIETPDTIISDFQKAFTDIASRGDLDRVIHHYIQ